MICTLPTTQYQHACTFNLTYISVIGLLAQFLGSSLLVAAVLVRRVILHQTTFFHFQLAKSRICTSRRLVLENTDNTPASRRLVLENTDNTLASRRLVLENTDNTLASRRLVAD